MRTNNHALLTVLVLLLGASVQAQFSTNTHRNEAQPSTGTDDSWHQPRLNTAANARYMKPSEREMIYEINRMRSNPQRYVQYLLPYLEEARADLKAHGHGTQHYSLTTHYIYKNGVPVVDKVDTTWHDRYQEEVDAIESLIDDLRNSPPMPILQPDRGIYRAAQKHSRDQSAHGWRLGHKGSDHSWPDDRITKFSPEMTNGNENIAGSGRGHKDNWVTPREIVILLLIDSGIPGYGHRTNMMNPRWAYGACVYGGYQGSMHRWIQNFGTKD